METDHFSGLWDRLPNLPDDPSLGEEEMRRGVALHFFEAGRIFAQTEIQQKMIAEAARIENDNEDHYDPNGAGGNALRTFAAGLIGLKDGG